MADHTLTLAKRPCPECDEPGEMVERGFETCLGGFPPHDYNCVEGVFACPKNHRFAAATQWECSCGWSGVKVCTISRHDQVRLLEDA